ncbi:hypothetical protein [Alysiella filiformis]|uniref:Uncharacterized protein n=1 Tax=Alysiella filiformis DSM 16848 TaxID=1120981 RepID=A0A286E7Z7_9NEIS|nr:hypothetical protein [Alysiella filiformis]QMT32026.1 hypothetical protein H3L97_03915 [Alysiella filiformis]UBQ57065.1 hypothetical protein JF568_04760 [Alysiella filiformis DSM 16848]SOD67013.1 hypothetical protein SAMN02746062_00774 [Alysiella filiformis DSM 16848]
MNKSKRKQIKKQINQDISLITQNVIYFANFVAHSDKWLNQYPDLYDIWSEMEICNAMLLDEWEQAGRPQIWHEWAKYQDEVIELVEQFFIQLRILQAA